VTDLPGSMPEHDELDHVLRRRRRRAIRGILAVFLIVVVVSFVIQNSQRVTVHFWFFTHKARLIWIVLACLVAGMVFGYLRGIPGRRKIRRRRKAESSARQPER
jgi:uncharacterized integral membrane protein